MGPRQRYTGGILLLLLILITLNCGSKGPPQLVPPREPLPVREISLSQQGAFIHLAWKFPPLLSDRETRLEPEKIRTVHIFYSDRELTPDNYRRRALADHRIQLEKIPQNRGGFHVKFPMKDHQLDRKTYYFVMYYRYRQKKSPVSRPLSLITVLPARPVSDLTLRQERKSLILKWSRPTRDISGEALQYLTGYRVYRKIGEKPENPAEFQLLNSSGKLLEEYYEDRETSREGTYHYYVVTAHGPNIESMPSNVVSVDIRNVFPPASPRNLVCVSAPEGLQLFWEPVEDGDLAYYRIYRRAEGEFEFKLLVERIQKTFYRDNDLQPGINYSYQVTAVDTAGNESDPSNTAGERVREY